MTDCDTDRHVLVVDNFTCTLYEAWRCQAPANELGEQQQIPAVGLHAFARVLQNKSSPELIDESRETP
jgi:hypothetical protein